MFCSNCGKSIRPEENACRHCGAILGENRFYGNTYTSSQVRIPAHEINNAPAGGRMSYTRTDYMSFDNQPAEDIYSGTTYRPLLSDEEDLTRIEAEEAARAEAEAAEAARAEAEAAEAARAEAEAAEAARAEAEAAEAARAEAEAAETAPAEAEYTFEETEEVEDLPQSARIIPMPQTSESSEQDEEEADDEDEYEDEEDPSNPFPTDIVDEAISPLVLSYMQAQEEAKNAPPRKIGGGLRIAPFLDMARKFIPIEAQSNTSAPQEGIRLFGKKTSAAEPAVQETVPEEVDQSESVESAQGEYDEAASDESAQDEYDEAASDEYAQGEYIPVNYDDAASDGYLPDDDYDASDADAQSGALESDEDEDYSDVEENAFQFDFAELWQRIRAGMTDLFKNRAVAIGIAAVLIISVLIGGISWLNYITAKRAKITGVTYSTYSEGIAILTANTSEEYRSERQQLYLTNTSMAASSFSQDMASLNALMPEAPLENDELFINLLTGIQDSIAQTIREDAQAELNGTSAQHASQSAAKWQSIDHAISQLSMAATVGELTQIVSELDSVVNPTPSPTPVPTPVQYKTLSNGMMDDMQVRIMQNALINLGYLSGEPDGDFGPGTESAVKAFQRAAGLTASGVADQQTLEALYSPDAPRTGGSAPSNPSAN